MHLAGESVLFLNESHRPATALTGSFLPPSLCLLGGSSTAERLPVAGMSLGGSGVGALRCGAVRCGAACPRSSVCGMNRRSAGSGSTRSLRRQTAEWLQTGGVSLDTTCRPTNRMAFSGGRLGNGGRMERPRVDELLMSLSFTKTERNFRSGSSECKQTEELQGEVRKERREGGRTGGRPLLKEERKEGDQIRIHTALSQGVPIYF